MASQDNLKQQVKGLTDPAILVHAPAGIGVFSPKALHFGSGEESIALTANQSVNISARKVISLNASNSASIYAQSAGIKLIAQQGDIKVQAQNDKMQLLSRNDLDIRSLDGSLIISAEKEIILNCGGAYIKIANGGIEVGTPKNVLLKTNNVQKMGAADFNSPKPEIKRGFREQFILEDEVTHEVLKHTKYILTTEDGESYNSTSGDDGKTLEVFTSTPQDIQIKTLRTRKKQ